MTLSLSLACLFMRSHPSVEALIKRFDGDSGPDWMKEPREKNLSLALQQQHGDSYISNEVQMPAVMRPLSSFTQHIFPVIWRSTLSGFMLLNEEEGRFGKEWRLMPDYLWKCSDGSRTPSQMYFKACDSVEWKIPSAAADVKAGSRSFADLAAPVEPFPPSAGS